MATSKKTTAKAGSKSKPKATAGRKKTTPVKKQANTAKRKPSSSVSNEISFIILAAASVFVFFSMYFENITGFIGAPVKSFFMGMFGIGAYILPLITIALAVVYLVNKDFKLVPIKVVQGASVFIAFLVFMHLLGYNENGRYESAINYIGSYYESGAANNGGLTGAAFGNVLLSIFGKFGAYLIIVIIFISMGMVFTGKSVIATLTGLYLEIKEWLEEARADDDDYEYEEEYEEEYEPKKMPVKAKPKKEQRPREQLRFEMPPVINERRRSRPPNIIIENRRKPSVEKDILIFNKEEKTMRKPILMPPTRKVVDVMTLKRPEVRDDIVITNNVEALSDFDIAPNKQGEEVYVETPLIRHYERRSFTESVPFSDGGRFKHPEAGEGDESVMPEEESEFGYSDGNDEALGDSNVSDASDASNTYDTFETEDTYSAYSARDTYSTYNTYNTENISDTYESTDDVDDASDTYDDTDDSIIPNAPEVKETNGESEYPDDFTQMMSDAYEQKLHEQEMNALMLAKTGPHPALGSQLSSPPAVGKILSIPQTPPQKPSVSSPMPFMEKKQVEKGTPISIIREDYSFPSISLLNKPPVNLSSVSRSQILETSRKLEETLKSFGVDARVIEVSKGPTVTRYELSPGPGVKVRKISDLGNDLALNLAAESIRIEAPIPGKAAVGIEIPNKEVTPVYLREVIDDDLFMNYPSKLAFALGKDITGNTVVTDIAKMPHLLIAGATGSGKSVCINTLITSLIYKADPNDVKLVMIDPKVVELSVYNGIPHLLIPVVTEPKKAAGALNWAVQEMLARYNAFAETSVRDLKGYNAYIREHGDGEPLPQIVIIIDELADLMMAAPGEVEDAICRLAQMARAAGLHLIIATQRPSVDVITGVIKANIPSRLAFSVSSGTDSRTILDMVGAEKLLGKGDMLFCPMGTSKPTRVQGAFITDKEVESIVNFLKAGRVHNYDMDVIAKISAPKGIGETNDELDEFFEDAIEFIIQKEKASASMLQRQFRIGYNRASRLIEEFETRGIVGSEDGSKPRKVLMTAMQFEEYKLNKQ